MYRHCPDLLRADQPEGRVLREPLGVVDILVARRSPVHRLPYKVGQRQLRVLSTRVGQVPLNERAEAQPLIQLSHQEQAAVRSDARTLEVDLQLTIERELKRLFLRLTHRRSISTPTQSIQTRVYQGLSIILSNW